MSKTGVQLRGYNPEVDRNFISHSWLLSFRDAGTRSGMIPADVYFQEQQRKIADIIARDTCRILLLVDKTDPNVVAGWICYESIDARQVLHYVYVSALHRKLGLSRRLLDAAGINLSEPLICTHATYIANILRKSKKINPVLLERLARSNNQ